MNKLEFTKGMKKLSTLYLKDMTEDELIVWYEMLKDVDPIVFDKAITTITKESKFFPSVAGILEKCEEHKVKKSKDYRTTILEKMSEDGYFRKGAYGDLSIDQEERNFKKAVQWLSTGLIPKWFIEDMKRYGYQEQNSLANTETKRIGVRENAII